MRSSGRSERQKARRLESWWVEPGWKGKLSGVPLRGYDQDRHANNADIIIVNDPRAQKKITSQRLPQHNQMHTSTQAQ